MHTIFPFYALNCQVVQHLTALCFSRDLNVKVPDCRHPDQSRSSQRKGENLGEPKGHALEHENLRSKVPKRHHIGPDGNVVNGA